MQLRSSRKRRVRKTTQEEQAVPQLRCVVFECRCVKHPNRSIVQVIGAARQGCNTARVILQVAKTIVSAGKAQSVSSLWGISWPISQDVIELEFRGSQLFYQIARGLASLDDGSLSTAETAEAVHGAERVPQSAVTTITRWSWDCLQSHEPCKQRELALPSRVIDISSHGTARTARLNETKGAPGQYIALSYRWGPDRKPLQTDSLNYTDHTRGVFSEDFPQVYKDVFCVAAVLGISYVWIDALCIIQDDLQDWDTTTAQMAQVYRDAFLVVIVASSRGPFEGFLRPHSDALNWEPLPPLIDPTTSMPTMHIRSRPVLCYRGIGYGDPVTANTAINRRAWAYQEHLMARRCLLFRHDEMAWECCVECQTETSGAANCIGPRLLGAARMQSRLGDVDDFSMLWRQLVGQYARRSLTERSDRLPAISALASYVAAATGREYLAGFWRHDILKQLAWSPHFSVVARASNEPEVYLAPSWSWASHPGPVGVLWPAANLSTLPCTLIDAKRTPAGKNAFGAVLDGYIVLEGYLCSSWVLPRLADSHEDYKIVLPNGDACAFLGSIFDYRNVIPVVQADRSVEEGRTTLQRAPDVSIVKRPTLSSGGWVSLFLVHSSHCLVLSSSRKQQGAYERLGAIHLENEYKDFAHFWTDYTLKRIRIV